MVHAEDPGAELRKWRNRLDVTQEDVAERMDVYTSVVSDYETGRRGNPGVEYIRKFIAAVLDAADRPENSEIHRYYTLYRLQIRSPADPDVQIEYKE